jgi:hypothetical protein
MNICRATKANGEACSLPPIGEHGFCWGHAPETKEKRRKVASRGGKAKAHRRTAVLWDEVREVIKGVEKKRLTPSQGNSMLRGFGVLIELARLEVEQSELEIAQRRLELDEQERLEVVKRLEELEEAMVTRSESSRWGA